MDNRDQKPNSQVHIIPPPKEFHSFETGGPFENCLECGRDLVNSNTPYFIEKAFRKYPGYKAFDVTYEFAMCMQCADDMKNELSKESIQKMQNYMLEGMAGSKRQHSLKAENPERGISPWLGSCLVTGDEMKDETEYTICGHFQSGMMIVADFPYALGATAMDQLADLLSNKTLDFLDDFMGRHFTGPPEINELFKPRRPVLI